MSAQDPSAVLDVALEAIVQVLTPSPEDWERRKRCVAWHVQQLTTQLKVPHEITISPFGSSLSGLCLADSDIDLGVFGRFKGTPLEALQRSQRKSLLSMLLKMVHRAHLARHQVQAIWGARVPVLKFTCSMSGLECDISLQDTGALVKAHMMGILNYHSSSLSPLYFLVKLWAQAHDLNDASRSTFNSTSLLYMTIFYLQQLQMLPALSELVPGELLRQPEERLLQGENKKQWDNPKQLQLLLQAVRQRTADWQQQYQQRQQQQPAPRLGSLLQGFFQMWSGPLSNWALGKSRDMHADLWRGTWAPGSFAKRHIFSLQDPFDASDCPARPVSQGLPAPAAAPGAQLSTAQHTAAGVPLAADRRVATLLHIGFVPSLHKSAPPAQVMQTLGLEIDSCSMQLRLTAGRVAQLQQLVRQFSSNSRCTKRELDSVVGRLQWASDVVWGGPLLLNPIRRCGLRCRKPHHKVYLRSEARLALRWWHAALQQFNGCRSILGRQPRPWQLLSTDACGVWDTEVPGIGIFVDGGFCGLTAQQCRQLYEDAPAVEAPIQLWELYAVLVMARLYGSYLQGQYWQLGVDNSNVFAWLSKGTVKGKVCYEQALQYLLQLFTLEVQLDFRLQPFWISSSTNVLADAASRQEWGTFRSALRDWLRQQGRSTVPALAFLQPC
ncbi:hypothetical protein OEZ85_003766 [Tetradesmus obliquus]|uniref:Poly(A) RNA polymerase mitochondrial-like central palm domain-containing protein n=1 Tax=Tetradesmus obliquus TaxID=3088 RepID=A0ABY8UEQ0_TETOB|nr:hypothetical protein OEZ85_003766 [Tetradesmus obliquus]